MSYVINKADGTLLVQLVDGTANGPDVTPTGPNASDLNLFGKNYPLYGQYQNENFIKLLQNFAKPTPPLNPLVGELWYDTGANVLRVYNSTAFVPVELYGNTNVAAYIPTDPTISSIQTGIASYEASTNSTLSSINANIGAFQNYANSTLATVTANLINISNTVSASGGTYLYTQSTPSSYWVVNHNLGVRFVNVQLIDNNNEIIIGRYDHPTITFVSNNQVSISFDYAASGYAYITSGIGSGATAQGNSSSYGITIYDVASYLNSGSDPTINAITASIVTANTAVVSYVNALNTAMASNVAATNNSIVTANTAVVSYVNALNTAMIANVAGANAAIVTANTVQSNQINALSANVASFYTYANATYSTIANAATLQSEINTLNANVGAFEIATNLSLAGANASIASLNANVGSFYTYANLAFGPTGPSSYSNANVISYLTNNPQSGTYSNANVTSYLPTYNGSINAGNLAINGNIAMTSNVARYTWVANVAPTNSQGSVGDIWYQTF